MKFISTNRQAPAVTFREALLQGLAPDAGLYWPESIPRLSIEQIQGWRDLSYAAVVTELLWPFVAEVMSRKTLATLCEDAYTFAIPLESVVARQYLMRLDQGPTASFKDFAARLMARMMAELRQDQKRELIILTATSGDTGSAIAQAFSGVSGIQVVILFPRDEVTLRQRKQMTTLGGNITAIALEGKFDDCQAMVKRAFSDPSLSHLPLTSANSINIGRLLPQMGYYAYAYSRLASSPEPITFVVPCGNFGNMMGAAVLRTMGLPVHKMILAVNENDEVPVFLNTGHYDKIEPSRNCLSNAMNVGHPSNLTRLVQLYGGQMDHTGRLIQTPNLQQMRDDFFAVSITDQQTRDTIVNVYQQYRVLLEPHGAVGWAGLQQYLREYPQSSDSLIVAVETAHPAKFPEAIRELLGFDPPVPPSLAAIESKSEQFDAFPQDYAFFAQWLRQRWG